MNKGTGLGNLGLWVTQERLVCLVPKDHVESKWGLSLGEGETETGETKRLIDQDSSSIKSEKNISFSAR